MKPTPIKCILLSVTAVFFLTACSNTADNINDFSEPSGELQSVQPIVETAADTDNQLEETVMVSESVDIDVTDTDSQKVLESSVTIDEASDIDQEKNYEVGIDGFKTMVRSRYMSLVLPDDNVDIDILKDCTELDIQLNKKTDLSFLTELPQLIGLFIYNGEENAIPEPSEESFVESYDFLNSLNNLEYLRISKEPNFSMKYLYNMINLKYLHFYGTNIDFDGYFPNIEELSIVGGEFSSVELYDFFPNLTGLETCYANISLESVGKMEKLEILRLSHGQSYKEINEVANNKNLRSLTLSSYTAAYNEPPIENYDFLLELTNLRTFWCLEVLIPEETINRLKELNPECDVFNHGL